MVLVGKLRRINVALQGIFASNQGVVGDRQGDFASAILQINPTGTSLLLALSSGMSKSAATDTVFTWFEDVHISGRSQCVSGGTTTTVVVVDGSFYVPGTILMVMETGEYMLVTATNGNSLTVTRGMAGTAIVLITSAMFVQNVGNARAEGSGIPVAVGQQGLPRMNYTQIFRNAWAITGTAKSIKFITGSRLAKNKRDCAMYHAEDMERAMIWGRKHVGTLGGNQFRMTDGILVQIESNGGTVLSAATDSGTGPIAGDLSMGDFFEFMREVFSTNVKGQPNERMAIGGDLVLSRMNRMSQLDGVYQLNQTDTKFGIAITTFVTPFGQLKLMTHPLMNENPVWQTEMYVVHPAGIQRRMLRETFNEDYDKNGLRIQGVDADQGVMTTEMGVEVGAASTMGILRNVQKAVKTV
jgi:hypothetical protein